MIKKVRHIKGSDLRPGHCMEVWFGSRVATISSITPYTGPLKIWDDVGGASIARFNDPPIEMTIEPQIIYSVVN